MASLHALPTEHHGHHDYSVIVHGRPVATILEPDNLDGSWYVHVVDHRALGKTGERVFYAFTNLESAKQFCGFVEGRPA